MRAAILALDLGTATGWAIRSPDGNVSSGTISFRPGRFEGGGMRYLRFRHWLTETLHLAGGFEQIAFEEVRRHAGVDAAHVYGGLLATLTAWAEHHGIPYQGVPVGTWKKALTGKGNACKADVVAAVKSLGYAPGTEDEADALGILLCRREQFGAVNRRDGALAEDLGNLPKDLGILAHPRPREEPGE